MVDKALPLSDSRLPIQGLTTHWAPALYLASAGEKEPQTPPSAYSVPQALTDTLAQMGREISAGSFCKEAEGVFLCLGWGNSDQLERTGRWRKGALAQGAAGLASDVWDSDACLSFLEEECEHVCSCYALVCLPVQIRVGHQSVCACKSLHSPACVFFPLGLMIFCICLCRRISLRVFGASRSTWECKGCPSHTHLFMSPLLIKRLLCAPCFALGCKHRDE